MAFALLFPNSHRNRYLTEFQSIVEFYNQKMGSVNIQLLKEQYLILKPPISNFM